MANYNSVDAFYDDLLNSVIEGIYKAFEEGKEIAKEYIEKEWYGRYPNPYLYDRCNALLDALVIDVKMVGKYEVKAEIHPINDYHPEQNWTDENKTFDGVFSWFADGEAYGRMRFGQKLDVIEHLQKELIGTQKLFGIIKDNLRKHGFDLG